MKALLTLVIFVLVYSWEANTSAAVIDCNPQPGDILGDGTIVSPEQSDQSHLDLFCLWTITPTQRKHPNH